MEAQAEPQASPARRAARRNLTLLPLRDEPTLASALEHVITASQGVITKRIDLALLEMQQLLTRTTLRLALLISAITIGCFAWLACTACLVLVISPQASLPAQLAMFGGLNLIAAALLAWGAQRQEAARLAVTRPAGTEPTLSQH